MTKYYLCKSLHQGAHCYLKKDNGKWYYANNLENPVWEVSRCKLCRDGRVKYVDKKYDKFQHVCQKSAKIEQLTESDVVLEML